MRIGLCVLVVRVVVLGVCCFSFVIVLVCWWCLGVVVGVGFIGCCWFW